jgi:hypothetical protein
MPNTQTNKYGKLERKTTTYKKLSKSDRHSSVATDNQAYVNMAFLIGKDLMNKVVKY